MVDAHSPNNIKVAYNGTNPSKNGELDQRSTPNYWLDMDGNWFELKKGCDCRDILNLKQGGDTDALTTTKEPIYVTQNNKKVFAFKAVVGEFSQKSNALNAADFKDHAIAKITLQSTNKQENKQYKDALNKAEGKTSPFYIAMDAEPVHQNWFEVKYEEVFDNRPNLWYYGEGNWFGLVNNTVLEYTIYHNGTIEKNNIKEPKEVIYNYFDSKGGKHILGESELIEVDKWKKKGRKTSPVTKILLVDARNIDKYASENIKFKILVWNTKKRFYISPDCFASLLGAMIEESIEDLSFNGFSEKDGSPGVSSTHLNGVAGDLRYLSTNKNGELILLEQNNFDYDRQVKFNKALYKFGWGRSKKMLSENFNRVTGTKEVVNPKTKKKEIIKVITKTLLPHTQHYKKKKKNGKWVRHNNHLHIYGFNFSIIKKK